MKRDRSEWKTNSLEQIIYYPLPFVPSSCVLNTYYSLLKSSPFMALFRRSEGATCFYAYSDFELPADIHISKLWNPNHISRQPTPLGFVPFSFTGRNAEQFFVGLIDIDASLSESAKPSSLQLLNQDFCDLQYMFRYVSQRQRI